MASITAFQADGTGSNPVARSNLVKLVVAGYPRRLGVYADVIQW